MTFTTAWFAAPLLLLIAGLGLWISKLRLAGAARRDERGFMRWQRAHGHAVEHVPFAVLCLFLVELTGGGRVLVAAIGTALVIARALHAYGTTAPHKQAKLIGAGLTYVVEIVLGVALLLCLVGVL
jgi:uncharacterized membrane protein YecN with MAPEG domain